MSQPREQHTNALCSEGFDMTCTAQRAGKHAQLQKHVPRDGNVILLCARTHL
jgi:hypothetical protein